MIGGFSGDFHYGLSVEELDRTPDVHNAVNFIIDYAIKNKFDFLSIGGDIFDNNTPLADHIALFISVLNRLEDAEIPTFVMMGNHEAISISGRMWALTPLQEIGYNNIHFITEPKLVHYNDILFLFLPHATKARAIDTGFKTAQEYIDHHAEKLVEEADKPITVISHYNVNGCKAGTEALMLRQSDLQIPGIVRRSPKVIQIINSHIHTAQEDGKLIMPGSPICTDFGDLENGKGFLSGEYGKDKWEFNTIETPHSPMQEFELELFGKNKDEIKKEINEAVKLVEEDSIVKVRVVIEEDKLSLINFNSLKEKFLVNARFVKQIDRVVMSKKQVRDNEQTPNLSPIDAVKRYIDKRNPDEKDRKLELALSIIEGGEVKPKEDAGPFLNGTAAIDSLDTNLENLSTDIEFPEEFSIS